MTWGSPSEPGIPTQQARAQLPPQRCGAVSRVRRFEGGLPDPTFGWGAHGCVYLAQEEALVWVGAWVVKGVKFYLSAGACNQVAVTKSISNAQTITVQSGAWFYSCLNAASVPYSCGVIMQKCKVSLMFHLPPCSFRYNVTS